MQGLVDSIRTWGLLEIRYHLLYSSSITEPHSVKLPGETLWSCVTCLSAGNSHHGLPVCAGSAWRLALIYWLTGQPGFISCGAGAHGEASRLFCVLWMLYTVGLCLTPWPRRFFLELHILGACFLARKMVKQMGLLMKFRSGCLPLQSQYLRGRCW